MLSHVFRNEQDGWFQKTFAPLLDRKRTENARAALLEPRKNAQRVAAYENDRVSTISLKWSKGRRQYMSEHETDFDERNIPLVDGRASIGINRYVFIDGEKRNAWEAYRRIVAHIAPSERDRWDEIVAIREGDRHGLYVWPRPNGFEFLATEAVLRDHDTFLLDLAQRIAEDSRIAEAEIRHGNLFVRKEESDYSIFSAILTFGEEDHKALFADQKGYLERYLAKEIGLAAKEFGFAIDTDDVWCEVESFRVLEKPFRPMRFCKEPQYAASEIRFVSNYRLGGIWQIGYFARFGYGRVFYGVI